MRPTHTGIRPKAGMIANDVSATAISIQANVKITAVRLARREPIAAPRASPAIMDVSIRVNAYVVGPTTNPRTLVQATSSTKAANPDNAIATRITCGPAAPLPRSYASERASPEREIIHAIDAIERLTATAE